jgi:spermidine synthase
MRNFIDINNIYPDYLESDNYMIFKRILTKEDIESWKGNIGEIHKGEVHLGKEYLFLSHKGLQKTMMSNHESETITNQKFIDSAKGDVLIFGLGLGLIIFPLLKEIGINKITIIELDKGLIDMVSPIIRFQDSSRKVKIINADSFFWETQEKFDTIYFDIWETIDEKAYIEMEILEKRYQKNLKEEGWIDSWCSELNNKNKIEK